MADTKYLRNNDTGAVFIATPILLEKRGSLNLSFASKQEYDACWGKKQEMAPAEELGADLPDVAEPEAALDPNRLTILVDAVAQLDESDPDHFNKGDGKPNARAIGAITGTQVTKAERDAAWQAYQEEQA